MNYQQQTLAVKNGVELVVALYDGMIRFLHNAEACIEAGDIEGRRHNMKRVLDILTYLQGRLQADTGGEAAAALSEFYAAMYSQCVLASRDCSVAILQETIRNVRNVRDAWQTIASSEYAQNMLPRDRQTREERHKVVRSVSVPSTSVAPAAMEPAVARSWSA